MSLFPVFANLQDRRVLVVGGGDVAERKVKSLLNAGAQVVVGSPTLTGTLQQLAHQGRITVFHGCFEVHWLSDAWLVVAATASHSVNQHVARAATVERIFINVVDDPDLSTFQVPSIVERSPLTIAVSSSGSAPVLARRLRERIESLFDHSLGPLAALAGKHRLAIRRQRPNPRQRREFYDWLLDGPVALALRQQQGGRAERLLTRMLQQLVPGPAGKVILVGAGPGDPGLLTLKALRALNEADVILHDRLISPEILALARRDAVQISVGKTPGANHDATQARIHRLMHKHAQAGKCVIRLKGGDALVFGRGGEELEFLKAQGIPYEIVPGITAALACAAYAGVPLTHRDHAQSARLTTAHGGRNKEPIDWISLAQERQTLAFYMGVGQLEHLSAQLIAHGRSGATPFALVENGSRADQRVLTGSLSNLPALAHRHQFQAPSLLLVGQVAALAQTLHWFGRLITDADPGPEVSESLERSAAVAACI